MFTAQMVYLEYLERTSNSKIMNRCDECTSDAIDLILVPVPFGDIIHFVAYVSLTSILENQWSWSSYIIEQLLCSFVLKDLN
jgi:hypothetical protein